MLRLPSFHIGNAIAHCTTKLYEWNSPAFQAVVLDSSDRTALPRRKLCFVYESWTFRHQFSVFHGAILLAPILYGRENSLPADGILTIQVVVLIRLISLLSAPRTFRFNQLFKIRCCEIYSILEHTPLKTGQLTCCRRSFLTWHAATEFPLHSCSIGSAACLKAAVKANEYPMGATQVCKSEKLWVPGANVEMWLKRAGGFLK